MSNRPNLKDWGINRSGRNLQVLIARGMAEVQANGADVYRAIVKHDDGCPGLAHQSMLWCECNPEIEIEKGA
jgi:hypothetical protein